MAEALGIYVYDRLALGALVTSGNDVENAYPTADPHGARAVDLPIG